MGSLKKTAFNKIIMLNVRRFNSQEQLRLRQNIRKYNMGVLENFLGMVFVEVIAIASIAAGVMLMGTIFILPTELAGFITVFALGAIFSGVIMFGVFMPQFSKNADKLQQLREQNERMALKLELNR